MTGCASSASTASADKPQASTSACTPAGTISDSVTVTGALNAAPTVKFKTPLETPKSTERSVVITGTGTEKATAGSSVDVSYSAFNAETGKQVDATEYGADAPATALTVDSTKYIPGLVKALTCSVAGDRVVAVIPPADGSGSAKDGSIVFVIDVKKVAAPPVVLAKANGVDQPVVAGLPTVKLAADGAPTITIPKTAPPATLTIANLKKGAGTIVAEGDTVSVEYTGVIWATGKTFDSSWTTAGPTSFPTTGVITGFSKALVGQAVGSQVLAVIPPADGYGDKGVPEAGISGTDTLVFVLDILGTTPAAG
nr:FKBP-type peptidyl-prolyl cis-trans isomerase [Leifsonia psychrotolerans]